MEKQMIIKLDMNEIEDDLYNRLLMAFVQKAVTDGMNVPKGSKMEDWTLSAKLIVPPELH